MIELHPQPDLIEAKTAPTPTKAKYGSSGSIRRWQGRYIDDDNSVTVIWSNIKSLLHSDTLIQDRTFYRLVENAKNWRTSVSDNFGLNAELGALTPGSDQSFATSHRTSGWSGQIDKMITELGRLKADWDGNGAIAPSPELINQMERALRTLPHDTKEPEVEVDPSDGSIAIRWWSDDNEIAFSMTFVGNEKLYGVLSSSSEHQSTSWNCSVRDETKIIDKIEHPLIRKVLIEIA